MLTHSACAWLRAGTAGCCLAAPSSQPSRGRACEPRKVGRARQRGLCASRAGSLSRGRARAGQAAEQGGQQQQRGTHSPVPALCRQQQQQPHPSPPSQAPTASESGVPGAGVGIWCRNHCPSCLLTPDHKVLVLPKHPARFPHCRQWAGRVAGVRADACSRAWGTHRPVRGQSRAGCCGCPRRCPAGSCVGRTGDKWELGVNSPGCQQCWSGA